MAQLLDANSAFEDHVMAHYVVFVRSRAKGSSMPLLTSAEGQEWLGCADLSALPGIVLDHSPAASSPFSDSEDEQP